MWVAALALLVDVALGALQRLLTPRGLRRRAVILGPPDRGTRQDPRLEAAAGRAASQ